MRQAVEHANRLSAGPDRAAVALAVGVALFLAGTVALRRHLRIGPVRLRIAAAVLALATMPIGILVALEVQLAVVTVLLVVMLVLERHQIPGTPG